MTGTASPPTVAGLLRAHAMRAGDRVAVRTRSTATWSTTTWAELRRAALSVAAHLGGAARPRGPAIVLVDNTPASVASVLGLALAGVDMLLVERENSYLSDERSVVNRLPATAIVCPADVQLPALPGLVQHTFDELTAGPPADDTCLPENPRSAVLQLTSGSTGEPKIARQTLGNTLTGGALYRDLHKVTEADTLFAMVPLAHSFGLVGALATALVTGAGLMTMSRFTPGAVLEGLRGGATVLLGTPLVYELIAPVLPRDATGTRVRTALSSGGPLTPRLGGAVTERLGVPVHQIYGSTETGLIACQYDRPEPWPGNCAGVMAPGVQWRLRTGESSWAVHGRGRLFVRTATMFLGHQGSTTSPLLDDGFLESGDLVEVDEGGHVTVLARKDTFVNVGGRKVNPRRVERVVAGHPAVREAFVYGRAAARDGEEEIHAALVLHPGADTGEIARFCRSRLMPYEVPHHIHVIPAVPRTGMGKVDRSKLLDAVRAAEERVNG
ncbi:class I adenylate-forming enzyme family protein [Streptomyces sp. NPDC026206]|uniref:class I adenylate-forming enzyme family protein n=1 Tax=Streptomyces sp. NPDC026206 TaxID=3157089 RepID=UPI0033D3F83F